MINNIVVAVDGSDHSRSALALASDLAAKFGASLSIYHVLLMGHVPEVVRNLSDMSGDESRDLVVGAAHMPSELPREVRIDIAEKLLAQSKEVAQQYGVREIDARWGEGPAARLILNHARWRGADTIVLGSRGLNALEEFLLGSVSHKVSHLFEGTVIIVN